MKIINLKLASMKYSGVGYNYSLSHRLNNNILSVMSHSVMYPESQTVLMSDKL